MTKRPSDNDPEVRAAAVEKLLPHVMQWLEQHDGRMQVSQARKLLQKPQFGNPEHIRAVALLSDQGDEAREKEREEVRQDLIKATRWKEDGYEITKELESSFSWDGLTFDFAEICDNFQSYLEDVIKAVVKQWVEVYRPVSRFTIGQAVQYRGAAGTVIRTNVDLAEYVVHVPSAGHAPTQGYVVAWECGELK